MADVERVPVRRPTGTGLLVAQVGALGSRLFGERVAAMGLTLPQSALLRAIAREPGQSQQALAEHLELGPSRLVVLIDELERAGVVERRAHPTDRRQRAVHLTDAGRARMRELVVAAADHEDALCRALDDDDRARLRELLGRIAADHGLRAGVHPGA